MTTPEMEALGGGLSGEARAWLCGQLGVDAGADDRSLARALVRWLASQPPRVATPVAEEEPPAAPTADASLLGRLVAGSKVQGRSIEMLAELSTLTALLRGGSPQQRGAAARRIAALVGEGARGQSGDDVREATDALLGARDVENAYELVRARAALPGATGREARSELEAFDELLPRLEERVRAFWSGERLEPPLDGLESEERAHVLLRVRDLPDPVVAHLAATVEGADGVTADAARLAVVIDLRHAGDPRLFAPLVALLDETGTPLVVEAARALARIDDARVRPLLRAAWERTAHVPERLALAAALGRAGDASGLPEVRTALRARGDDVLVTLALEALETTGTAEDVMPVAALLTTGSPRVVDAAVRALGGFGDVRALAPLESLSAMAEEGALTAAIEAALTAVRARMDLRGEEPPRDDESTRARIAVTRAAAASVNDPATVRVRALWDFFVGRLWQLVGARARAVARFEAAAARRVGWPSPLLAVGVAFEARGEHAQALSAFRRALERDRRCVRRAPLAARALARCFLRRADEVERAGRRDVARGLLEEVVSLDLRWAEAGVRFEIVRRHDALRLSEGP